MGNRSLEKRYGRMEQPLAADGRTTDLHKRFYASAARTGDGQVRLLRRAFVLAAGIVFSTADLNAAEFFRPGPSAPSSLPSRGIFPQGKVMHIGGYSPAGTPIKELGGVVPIELASQSGFTVAGPYYASFAGARAMLERAAALGMHVAVQLQVPPSLAFQGDEAKDSLRLRGPRMAVLPEAELRAWVQKDMNQYLNHPVLGTAVSCWAVSPEELRWWMKEELAYEKKFLKAANDFDPQHRPVYMYEPNHRDTNALLKTGPGQGFVLEGAYVHSFGWDVRRALRINWAMDQVTSAAAQDKRVVVPGLQLSQDMPGLSAQDLQSDPGARTRLRRLLRHDVYLAICRGAQGFQVWSLHHSRPKLTTYLELMNGYGEVFRELTSAPLNLQEPILFGERRDDISTSVVKGPAYVRAALKQGKLEAVEGKINIQGDRWPSVRFANIAYENYRVLILVNSSDQSVQVSLAGIPDQARVSVTSGGDAATVSSSMARTKVDLEAFASLVLRISNPGR